MKLTDEQIHAIASDGCRNAAGGIYRTSVVDFARAIEAHVLAAQPDHSGDGDLPSIVASIENAGTGYGPWGSSYVPKSAAVEVAGTQEGERAAFEATPHALYDAIEETLMHHRLSHFEGDDGEAFPLVDHLTTPGDRDIGSGKLEIRLICDEIYNEVLMKAALAQKAVPVAATPPQAVLDALRELVRLEDLKDQLERSLFYVGRGIDEHEYARAKPKAWKAARAALAPIAPPDGAVPHTFAHYENGRFIQLYWSAEAAAVGISKFGGNTVPLYTHPAAAQDKEQS